MQSCVRDCNEQLVIAGNIVRSGHGGAGTRGASGLPGIDAPDNAVPGEPERISQADVCIANDVNLSEAVRVADTVASMRTKWWFEPTAEIRVQQTAPSTIRRKGLATSGSGANGAGQGGAGATISCLI